MEQNINLDWAIYYLQQGLTPMPVRIIAGEKKDEKKPMVAWKQFQTRRPTMGEIHGWFDRDFRGAAIGLLTGPGTGLLVLDVEEKGLELIKQYEIPKTWTVRTRRGNHYYFKWTDKLNSVTTNLSAVMGEGSGVDTRGLGGFVVAPPSRCGDGTYYGWLPGCGVTDTGLADVPEWLIQLLLKTTVQPLEHKVTPLVKENWLEKILDGISDGGRHAALVRLAGYYFGRMAPDLAVRHLQDWNKKNKPPIDDAELALQIRDLKSRFERGEYKSNFVEKAAAQPMKPIETVSAKDIMAHVDETKWLIKKFIPETGLVLMGGEPGVGKTWIALDLAIEASRGGKWLGQFECKKTSVLYVDEEKTILFYKERLPRLLKEKGLTLDDLPLTFSIDKGIKLDLFAGLRAFEELVEKAKPGLVIMDALVDFHSKEEKDSTAIMVIFNAIKEIRRKYGCTFVILDHERKPTNIGKDGRPVIHADSVGNDLRGSNAKRGAVDTQLSIKKVDGMSRVYSSKTSWSKAVPPFAVQIIDPTEETTRLQFEGYL